MTRIDVRQGASGGGGGGGASTPPGQAAHYIGTWDVAVAYAAGDCVRQWDGAEFKLYQAKTATTGDDPTSVVASWAEVTTPIVMWGAEDPNLTDAVNAHGAGIVAPFMSSYLLLTDGGTGRPGLLVFTDADDTSVQGLGYWDSSTFVFTDSDSNGLTVWATRGAQRRGAGSGDSLGNTNIVRAGEGDGSAYAGVLADRENGGAGDAYAGPTAERSGAGAGDAVSRPIALRGGSGAGDAAVHGFAMVDNTAVGTAYAGGVALHHAGTEAHVVPTATATEAFNDVKGPIDAVKQTDAAAPAANHGRLYLRDNGSGKMQFVARFPSGAVQVIATEP